MPREKPCARANAARIREVIPGKEILFAADVVKFTGLDIKTVKKIFGFNKKQRFLSVEDVARIMSASQPMTL